MLGILTPEIVPRKDILDAAFLVPNKAVLDEAKQALISGYGYRKGIPEPKRAFFFDGTDDGLQVPDPYNFLANGDLKPATVRYVIRFPALTNTTPVACSALAASGDRRWHIRRTGGGQIEIRFMNSNASGSRTIALTDSTFTSISSFYDITFTYNGVSTSSIKIYINGIEVAHTLTEDNFTGNTLASSTINVGRINSGTFASVYISSLEIFDSVLSSDDLEKLWKYTFRGTRILYWKCDENEDSISFDSSGNENHGTISNHTTSTFFYEGADVPFSFQNEIGFTLSDGATYYREAALTNLIPSGVYIPRDEANPTKCTAYITGGVQAELVKKGKIRQLAKITNVNVGNPDGVDDILSFSDLTGITIVSSEGTSIPSINGNNIEFTAGTIWSLELSNGSFYSFNEGGNSDIIYDLHPTNGLDGTWGNETKPGISTKDDTALNYLLINGCEIYDDDATHTDIIRIPFRNDGTRITPTISGYSKVRELLPIEKTKEFDNDYDCEIDFQYYKALVDTLPADYQEGDALPDEMLVDTSKTDKAKKFVIAREDISTNQRLKNYTKTT